jgi:BirA family transcriptional regulator, biotin operon repressor / biotin---[acetyl-CoA-carboxylase] ligase
MKQNQIIELLKTTSGYLSGEEISRQFKISRAGIWKNIEELRKNGYDIEAVSHKGYKLKSTPDKLLPREIQFKLNTSVIGKDIIHFETIESTMTHAFQLGVDGREEGVVVCAETQTKGKGRLGRPWVSPKGKGIYLSILLRPQLHPTEVAKLTLMTAVAVLEAIRETTGLDAKIKWPNDILIKGKKVVGILTEMSAEMERVRFVVVGIGINVNTPVTALPETGTSLKHELGKDVDRIKIFQSILRKMECWYERSEKGFDDMIARWKELSSTIGSRVKVQDMDKEIIGTAMGLDEYGGLIIRYDSGKIIKRMTGDVVEISK